MTWRLPEDEANDDLSYAMTEGFALGKTGRTITEDDLIVWPWRLRKSFRDGYNAGRERFKEQSHDPR